jgi:hypothetical protein
LTIARNLTLNGAGAASTILDGGGTQRVIRIASGTVAIAGVTIRNGHPLGDGGGISNSGALTLSNSVVTGTSHMPAAKAAASRPSRPAARWPTLARAAS